MKTLSQTEIRALYGFAPKHGDFVVYGRAIKHANPGKTKRQPTYDEIMKFRPSRPKVQFVESDVTEIF